MNEEIIRELMKITPEEEQILRGRREVDTTLYRREGESAATYDAAKLLETGRLISIRKHTRFIAFPAHRHNYVEVIYMCRGETRHRINGQEVRLSEGELLFLNQNAVQEIEAAKEQDLAVNFIILPEFFDAVLPMIDMDENLFREFLIQCIRGEGRQMGTSFMHFRVAGVLPVQNLVENLIWSIMNRQPNRRSINQVTMGLLLLQLLNNVEQVETGEGEEQKLVFRVMKYIEGHYREAELTSLSRELHYDVSFLSREVKRQTGKTFTELLQDKRLTQAAYLLSHTTMPVGDVGISVGYENLSYFHRIFEKRYGTTPGKFRKNQSTQR